MTIDEMKAWVDSANYEDLLYKWRFEPVGSPWFDKDMGDYFAQKMRERKSKLSSDEQVAASKRIGWAK